MMPPPHRVQVSAATLGCLLALLPGIGTAGAGYPGFFREQNPVVRHTILRRRRTLEDAGLMPRVGVDLHPDPKAAAGTYAGVTLEGAALLTNYPFQRAYTAAEAFSKALGKRMNAAGFMKSLLLQRICSSFEAGRATARRLRDREVLEDEEFDARTLVAMFYAIIMCVAYELM